MQTSQGVGICCAWLRWQLVLCNRSKKRERWQLISDCQRLLWSIGDARLRACWLQRKVSKVIMERRAKGKLHATVISSRLFACQDVGISTTWSCVHVATEIQEPTCKGAHTKSAIPKANNHPCSPVIEYKVSQLSPDWSCLMLYCYTTKKKRYCGVLWTLARQHQTPEAKSPLFFCPPVNAHGATQEQQKQDQ